MYRDTLFKQEKNCPSLFDRFSIFAKKEGCSYGKPIYSHSLLLLREIASPINLKKKINFGGEDLSLSFFNTCLFGKKLISQGMIFALQSDP